jgi:hypothetical protein
VEGGGYLTPYGKGIAHAESLYGGEYKATSEKFMEHGFQERFMLLQRMYDYNGKKTRFFPMQLDYTNIIHWQKNLRQEVVIGVAPSPTSAKKSSWVDRIYARTFKLDYTIDKNNRLVVGGANLPLGVRLVDHTAYVRERNRLGVTDVPLQVQYINLSKEWQQTYLAFSPNPSDGELNKEYGLASKQEYFPLTNLALGSQVLIAKGKTIDREILGVFSRTGKGPVAFLGELDFTKRKLVDSNIKFDQWTSFIETSYNVREYLKTAISMQALRVNRPFKEKEELYSFSNEFKITSHFSCLFEYRQKSTDVALERILFVQAYLNWW